MKREGGEWHLREPQDKGGNTSSHKSWSATDSGERQEKQKPKTSNSESSLTWGDSNYIRWINHVGLSTSTLISFYGLNAGSGIRTNYRTSPPHNRDEELLCCYEGSSISGITYFTEQWNLTDTLGGLWAASENICCIWSVLGLGGTWRIHWKVCYRHTKIYVAFASF